MQQNIKTGHPVPKQPHGLRPVHCRNSDLVINKMSKNIQIQYFQKDSRRKLHKGNIKLRKN